MLRQCFMIMCVIYIWICCTARLRVDKNEVDGIETTSADSAFVVNIVEYSEKDDNTEASSDILLVLNGTKKTAPDDPALLQYIKDQVVPPATKPLHLSQPLHTGQVQNLVYVTSIKHWCIDRTGQVCAGVSWLEGRRSVCRGRCLGW